MGVIDFLRRLFEEGDQPDRAPTYDKAGILRRVRELAALIDEYIENLSSPVALTERPEFQEAVELLATPCFTNRELLEFSDNPPDAIWQLGVAAAGKRDPDPDLVDPLLALFSDGWPWHKYFAMNALLAHTPIERSLAGEFIFRYHPFEGPQLEYLLKITAPVLRQRVEAGEKPAFGDLLKNMDGEKAEGLKNVLKAAMDSPLKEEARPLLEEFDVWRTSFVDLSVLEEIGRVWDPGGAGRPLVLEHPQLATDVGDVVRSLTQDPPRSVLVTGEHGVGKTALVNGIAKALMDRGWVVFQASGSDLIAGQMYIGQFEERARKLIDKIGGGRKVLWYIPDFQSLGWIGKTTQSNSSALDVIYPQLESGNITVLGELTATAHQQIVQDKPRLLTTCEVCRVSPLEEKATLELASAWATAVQSEDAPPLLPEATLKEAWLLARQYMRDREAPGCLLEFLDLTRKALMAEKGQAVTITRDDLITTLTVMTGLPRQILDDRQMLDPEKLRVFFEQRILGQPEAVGCLVERISLIKAGLTDPSRPQGVFLFAGPTGTGKTEIAKALATFLFGSEDRLLRYDMSELQTPESLERLVGDGQQLDRESLAMKIRKQPFSVILLDEFEKGHPKAWDLFLQVFDDGRLTDPMGRTSDFRHAIIILTSNLGGQAATGAGLGFDQSGQGFRATEVGRAVNKAFRPEFLNRLDRVVVFRPFTRDIMRAILEKELRDVQERRGLRNRSWAVVWEDSALEFLLDKGFSPTLGARPLKRAVEQYLLTPLADIIVKGTFPAGDQFLYIQTRNDGLAVDFIDPDAADESGERVSSEADGDPCGKSARGKGGCLAAIALNPAGTPGEMESLWARWEELKDELESPAWKEAKSLALSMTSVPDFWTSSERFAVLGEVEYRERVETGLETVGSLLNKIAPQDGKSRDRFPRKLVGQAADRMGLLERARRSLETRSPWEAFVLITDKQGPTDRGTSDHDWVGSLGGMYRNWGQRCKMRVQTLENTPSGAGRSISILLGVSGYAAFDILESETGLHVWEQPGEGRDRGNIQQKALVRIVAMPDDRVANDDVDLLAIAREVLAVPMVGAPALVRTYRQVPDPLVKDRAKGWRSGRLERVLGGDFDLLGACADHDAGAGGSVG